MVKLCKSLFIGATVGAVAAYFFSTTKGKEAKEKASEFITDYKENTEEYHQRALDKANSYKEKAVDKFNDYKSKYDNSDLTVEDLVDQVKEKASLVKDMAVNTLNHVTSEGEVSETSVKNTAEVDDIVIEYPEEQENQEE